MSIEQCLNVEQCSASLNTNVAQRLNILFLETYLWSHWCRAGGALLGEREGGEKICPNIFSASMMHKQRREREETERREGEKGKERKERRGLLQHPPPPRPLSSSFQRLRIYSISRSAQARLAVEISR